MEERGRRVSQQWPSYAHNIFAFYLFFFFYLLFLWVLDTLFSGNAGQFRAVIFGQTLRKARLFLSSYFFCQVFHQLFSFRTLWMVGKVNGENACSTHNFRRFVVCSVVVFSTTCFSFLFSINKLQNNSNAKRNKNVKNSSPWARLDPDSSWAKFLNSVIAFSGVSRESTIAFANTLSLLDAEEFNSPVGSTHSSAMPSIQNGSFCNVPPFTHWHCFGSRLNCE